MVWMSPNADDLGEANAFVQYVGHGINFYRHRLTNLGLLLPAAGNDAHNTPLLDWVFGHAKSVKALLWQYSDLRHYAKGVNKLTVVMRVAGLAKKDQVGRSS